MTAPERTAKAIRERILHGDSLEERAKSISPRPPKEEPLPRHVPGGADDPVKGMEKRRALLREQGFVLDQLTGAGPEIEPADLAGNIENFVGFSRIPVGVIGPLRVNGTEAHGDFYVPMATNEAALVASYHRGACVISQAGGASVVCTTEAVTRAPCFVFENMRESATFLSWVIPQYDSLQETVSRASSHCKLQDVRTLFFGKEVFLAFEYATGDAAGQNMVTIATKAVCEELVAESPVKPKRWYVEGNMSGDKKATMLSFVYARGKRVIAEAIIPRKLVRRYFHLEPTDLVQYWQTSVLGGIQSGSIGVQGHFANALAAIFIACWQDAACVSEASIGMSRVDVTDSGDLYAFAALPNLIVGTVGGGTHLPTARECLEMIDCFGTGKARKFSEICGAVALAGELSIGAAMAAHQFTDAHATHRRAWRSEPDEACD